MTLIYITKADIVSWINIQITAIGEVDIPTIILEMAEAKVNATLVGRSVKTMPTANDAQNFLKFAAFCFCLAILCKSRLVTQSTGDVLRDRFGDVVHDYQRANPLFFFAQGTSQSFMALLPYETFRMYAYAFCDAYMKYAHKLRTGNYSPEPQFTLDRTSRGYNWEEDTDLIDVEDDTSYSEDFVIE